MDSEEHSSGLDDDSSLLVRLTPAAFLRKSGGVRRMALELDAALRELGVEVTSVIDFGTARSNGPDLRANLVAQLRQQRALLTRNQTEVVHSLYYDVPVMCSDRLVVTVHDMIHERLGIGSRRLRIAKQRAVRNASVVVCDSQCTVDDLRQYGASHKNIRMIPLGVSQEIVRGSRIARPFGEDSYLLYVGDRAPYKNFAILMNTLAASPELDHLGLLIIGGSPLSDDELKHMRAQRRDLADVRQIGGIDDVELGEFYRGASALVVTSRYEGFGLPLLEAMACGCPVASSGGGSLSEFDNGLTFRFDPDSIDQCRSAIGAAMECGTAHTQAAMEHARTFSWQRTASAYCEVYDQLATP